MHYYTSPILPLEILWTPLDALWTSSGYPLEILWTSSGHLYLLVVLVFTSSKCHPPDVLCIFFVVKGLLMLLLFFQSQFYCVNVPGFLDSWYHIYAQLHLRSESLWFLLMLMYALLYIPNPSSGDPLDPSGCPLDILRISFGNPLDIFIFLLFLSQHPLDALWTSSRHSLHIYWTSSGHTLDILWTSSGHPLDIFWDSFIILTSNLFCVVWVNHVTFWRPNLMSILFFPGHVKNVRGLLRARLAYEIT